MEGVTGGWVWRRLQRAWYRGGYRGFGIEGVTGGFRGGVGSKKVVRPYDAHFWEHSEKICL